MRHRTRTFSSAGDVLGQYTVRYPWRTYPGQIVKVDPVAGLRPYYRTADCFDALHPGPPYTSGGPFLKIEYTDGGLTPLNPGLYNQGWDYYEGAYNCSYQGVANLLQYNPGSWYDVSSYGAEGWKKFRPAQPAADMAQFIAELKDVPRMLQSTCQTFRALWYKRPSNFNTKKMMADTWLNANFGWLPFVSDVRKFYKAYKTVSERLDRIIKYNGQWQKRGGELRCSEEAGKIKVYENTHFHRPFHWTNWYASSTDIGTGTIQYKANKRVWFEGRFRYYIPPKNFADKYWRRRAVARLFGADFISPSLMWELTPFSWLIDYFSNVGDVFANCDVGLADNLAAKYAYIMGTTNYSCDVTSTMRLKQGPIHGAWTYSLEGKHRSEASPFGFDLSDDDLSARQWSILGALGLSRLR